MKKVIKKVKKPERKGVLTIDQSLNGSAIIYSEDNKSFRMWYCTDKKKNMTEHATLIDVKKLNDYSRLQLIEEWLLVILSMCNPKYVVLEGYAFGGTGRAFQLGELGGMIKLNLWKEGYEFMAIPPDSIKLFATGYGNATKTMMVAKAITEHKVDFSQFKENGEDLADAFWINKMVFSILECKQNPKILKKIPEHQRRAIADKKGKKKMPALVETEFYKRE